MQPEIQTHAGLIRPGTHIRILHLENGDSPIDDSNYDFREGTVEEIDDIGGLHGTWGGLAVYDSDQFEILS